MKSKSYFAIAFLFIFGVHNSAQTAPIMYDFGGLPGSSALGPGHYEGTIAASETNWIYVPENDSGAAGLIWGIETTTTSKLIDWDPRPTLGPRISSISSSPTPGGVFDNDVLGDSLRTATNIHGLGAKIALSPGDYAVYYTGDSDVARSQEMALFAGTDQSSALETDYSSLLSVILPNLTDDTFVLNDNYARFDISVGLGESLVFVSEPTHPTGEAVYSSLQIVKLAAVPEPMPIYTFALGICGILIMRRKKII